MKCDYQDHLGNCEGEVQIRGAMTQYPFEGVENSPEDPNRDFPACDAHYAEYEAHWNAMWAEYNGIVEDNMRQAITDMEIERRNNEIEWEMENEARQREIEEDEYRRECNRRYEDGDF